MGVSQSKLEPSDDCYPRYAFMKKKVNDLLVRERKLIDGSKSFENRNKYTARGTIIINVLQADKGHHWLELQDILIKNASCKQSETELYDNYLNLYVNKERKYSLSKTTLVLLEQNLYQTKFRHKFAVTENEADYNALSKRLKRKKNTHVCLKGSVSKEICKVLERNVFHILKSRCNVLTSFLDSSARSEEEKSQVECLLFDINGLYSRSNVPLDKRPNLSIVTKCQISEELLRDLRYVSKKIRFCGFNNRTLEIFVDEKSPSSSNKEIETVLRKHGIDKYEVKSSFVKRFTSCSPGSTAIVYPKENSRKCHFGTLTGFVRGNRNARIYALISHHLAIQSYNMTVHISASGNNSSVLGHIVKNTVHREQNQDDKTIGNVLDVSAACIEGDHENKCDFIYMTEDGKSVPGILCEYGPDQLQGLDVHIWGACTRPGTGTISIAGLKSVQEGASDECYVTVKNRKEKDRQASKTNAFCQEGDSGVVVGTDDPDTNGEKVQLISMVVGKFLNGDDMYCTAKLSKCIEQIETDIGKSLSLCSD